MRDLLSQWKDVTRSERASIESENWDALSRQHDAKRHLQASIEAHLENHGPVDSADPLNAAWQDIIEAEKGNAALLGAKLDGIRAELDGMNRSSLQLGRIRHAYTNESQNYWASYS